MNDKHFTHDEVSLMSIYNAAGTREGLIAALTEMRGYLDAEEAELREIVSFACTAAGLSTTRHGGIQSVPELGDVIRSMR